MITINPNSTMLSLRSQLDSNIKSYSTSLKRMSSGLKITKASDGAAEVVMSSKTDIRISGVATAQKNTQSAIAMLDAADSYLSQMSDIVSRIRDLSLQAMNGTYSDAERKVMQDEVDALTNELQRQKNNATFNKIQLFNEKVDETQEVKEPEKLYKAQLEYIQSTGTEYINTGVVGKTGLSCDIDMSLTGRVDDYILASKNGNDRFYLAGFVFSGYVLGYGNYYSSNCDIIYDEKQNIKTELNNGSQKMWINDELKISQTVAGDIDTGLDMYLFAMNLNGSSNYNMETGTKLYACKIYDQGTLVRDYIPVVDNNDVACLYDKVSGEFFYNEGGGNFIRGQELALEVPDKPPDPPDTGPPEYPEYNIQVGSQAGIDNTIKVELGFTLDDFKTNVSTVSDAEETLRAVDKLQKTILEKCSEIGATRNRLDGIIEAQNNEMINLKTKNSIIKDTDYAQESCNLAKSQILQQVTLSLMSQCQNNHSSVALNLLNFSKSPKVFSF